MLRGTRFPYKCHVRRRIHVCHMRRRIHVLGGALFPCVSYEEDTCMCHDSVPIQGQPIIPYKDPSYTFIGLHLRSEGLCERPSVYRPRRARTRVSSPYIYVYIYSLYICSLGMTRKTDPYKGYYYPIYGIRWDLYG